MDLLLVLVPGVIVGASAQLFVRGREPGGWILAILIGACGSFVGAFLGQALGVYESGQSVGGTVLAVVGAVVFLLGYYSVVGRREST